MKTITTYEAFDGKVFATEKECRNHEENEEKALRNKVKFNSYFDTSDYPFLDLIDSSSESDWYKFYPTCEEDMDAVVNYLRRFHPFCEDVKCDDYMKDELYIAVYNYNSCDIQIISWTEVKKMISDNMKRFES